MKRIWLALTLFAHATGYAQAPARGAFAGIGMHSADVDELNALVANGYPDFSDEFINFSVVALVDAGAGLGRRDRAAKALRCGAPGGGARR